MTPGTTPGTTPGLTPTLTPWTGQVESHWPAIQRMDYHSAVDGQHDWALWMDRTALSATPSQSGKPSQLRRCVINLHGHGSTGDQLYTRPDVRAMWLPALLEAGVSILTPNLRGNAWMGPAALVDLHSLIAHLRSRYAIDQFILASGSMGGTGSLIYASQHPEDIAGVLALCPATDLPGYHQWCGPQEKPTLQQIRTAISDSYGQDDKAMAKHSTIRNVRQLTMPVVVVHGDGDKIIPVEQSRELAKALKNKADFLYIEQPGGHHDSPRERMAEGFAWLMLQIDGAR